MRIWDCALGECTAVVDTRCCVAAIAFDAQLVVTASYNAAVACWDLGDGGRLRCAYHGHTSAVFSVDFSVDSDAVVAGSTNGAVMCWSLDRGDSLASLRTSRRAWVRTVKLVRGTGTGTRSRTAAQSVAANFTIVACDGFCVDSWRMDANGRVESSHACLFDRWPDSIAGFQLDADVVTVSVVNPAGDGHRTAARLHAFALFGRPAATLPSRPSGLGAVEKWLGGGSCYDVWLAPDAWRGIYIVSAARNTVASLLLRDTLR